MPINADKPHLWKADTRASVDQFNQWFMRFAPKAYRDTRKKTIESVGHGLTLTKDLTTITPDVIRATPGILPTLRMSTCPPLARDRLIGLADSTKNLVGCLEEGKLPARLSPELVERHLGEISDILARMLDVDIFPWLAEKRRPTKQERYRSSTIVADRLCGAVAEPLARSMPSVAAPGFQLSGRRTVPTGRAAEFPLPFKVPAGRARTVKRLSGKWFSFERTFRAWG